MEPSNQQQLEALSKTNPAIEPMLREHRTLDQKVRELSEKAYLTAEEDMEFHRLKKEKLLLKDKLESLLHDQKSA